MFIVISCLLAPFAVVRTAVPDFQRVFAAAPPSAVFSAIAFGFAWGFGAICFGQSVSRLGVSPANTLVIGMSSVLGSLVPLALAGRFGLGWQQILLSLVLRRFCTASGSVEPPAAAGIRGPAR